MAVTLSDENMLGALEGSGSGQRGGDSHDSDGALRRFGNVAGKGHSGIRYSDGKARESSFDD